MKVTGGTPNLINGVSKQPPEVRLTSQLEESENQFPTITRGLVPRNPLIQTARIASVLPTDAKVHLIERDETEQYVATIAPNGITVRTLDGTAKTVSAAPGFGYLSGATADDLEALTVQDHTFILNKARVVGQDTLRSQAVVQEALVHIVQGEFFNRYEIRVNGNVVAHYVTDGGPYEDQASARAAERGAKPSVIAKMLTDGSPGSITGSTLPVGASIYLRQNLPTTDWAITLLDNVIHIRNLKGANFTISVDGGSETRMRVHKGQTPDLSLLPKKAPNGFRIKVAGDEETSYDDYWVKYTVEEGQGEGVWKETIAPNTRYRIDPTTMPHMLVRNADGTFTFREGDWSDREVGDDDTNPWPSFVGQKIAGMTFGNNRVGFHSGESISLSRNGDFFNFWAESILAPLDTDPVDVAVSYPEVSTIHHVVPFSGEVLLFTESVPFRLSGGDTLTQRSARIDHLLSNKVSRKVRPAAAGSHLYFVNDTPSGCFVHEFSYDRAVDNLTAECITDHVPGYIPANVTMLEADGDLKILALFSEDTPKSLYIYKWFWVGGQKAQAAWQRWTLPHNIIAMKFYGERLVIVTNTTNGWEVGYINCHEAWTQGLVCPIYLDRQVTRTGTHADGITTLTLPYVATGAIPVSIEAATFGQIPPFTRSGSTLRVEGDWTNKKFAVGVPFDSYAVLSPLIHRSTNNQGSYGNGVAGMLTTVASLRLSTGLCTGMKVEITKDYRKPYTYNFNAALVGTKAKVHGKITLGYFDKSVSIMAKSEDFKIKIGNVGPFPYSLLSYAWTGDARQISY